MKGRSLLFGVLLIVVALVVTPQRIAAQVGGYVGGGVLQAGDAWESMLPQGFGASYTDAGTAATLGTRTFLRLGNFDRSWTTPATHWPAAYPITPYWFRNAMVLVYDPDPAFNPEKIGGLSNPSYFAGSRNTSGLYSEFAQLTYRSQLQGASDMTRKYYIDPEWIDGSRRQHLMYEAAWPTNVGIDVTIRAHAFQGPNWNNLNDFVIVEVQLKNTGVLDMNMDGIPERIDNEIKALALQLSGEAYMSISSYGTGARSVNDIVPSPIARQACWIADVDENGHPWAFTFYRAAPTTASPTAGNWDFGFNGGTSKHYTDIYTGWVMIDAKAGALPVDRSKSSANLPTKKTVFGTHPIGTGTQRGWFVSGHASRYTYQLGDPRKQFYIATAAFYADCGRTFTADFSAYNLAPNPKIFSAGTPGDPLSFVTLPEAGWTRPSGSMQSAGLFDQISTEDGKATATADYPAGFGRFSLGASHTENFEGDSFSGIGPFSIPKDSTITLVFATVAGYRLEGIQKAVRAARWAYSQDFALPVLPPMPEMLAKDNANGTITVEWDNRAEAQTDFAGYKIWRATNRDTVAFLDEGMRIVDRYQEQSVPGPRPASVYKPVNPKFDAFAKTLGASTRGTYTPDTWGTWTLMSTIRKSDLALVPPSTSPGYNYRWMDTGMVDGASYWYYVSAFTQGNYVGPGGDTTSQVETHYTNRNGASGLWVKTYPFAPHNVSYPTDSVGRKEIGAAIIPRLLSVGEVTGDIPLEFSLGQNYPNPFNPSTVIEFTVSGTETGRVKLAVYDLLGREVALLVDQEMDPGRHAVQFDATGLSSGVYYYRATAGRAVATRSMVVVR